MVVDPELGRAGRTAPRWLDQPRGEAFLLSLPQLSAEEERTSWPSWLSPPRAEGTKKTGRSGGYPSPRSTKPARHDRDDDPRLPPGIPAPTGA